MTTISGSRCEATTASTRPMAVPISWASRSAPGSFASISSRTPSTVSSGPWISRSACNAYLVDATVSRQPRPPRFTITLLIMFTAGNLLPPQVLAAPLFSMFKFIPLPLSISDSGNFLNTYYSVIMVNTAFQIGFCTFVLSNYMKALPQELTEAALVDGAGVWKQYYTIVMPLCRPALAALATLEVIFIYNEFFWPLLFIQSGSRLPITTGIKNLQGQFFSDYNLIAAGATFTIIPTLIIYLLLQRHFVAGLTLGASKG
jgi:multiple sugar transport system permease protein